MSYARVVMLFLSAFLACSQALAVSTAKQYDRRRGLGDLTSVEATCQALQDAYPDLTLFSGQSGYTTLNEAYWSRDDWLGPACIFTPSSAALMAHGIQTLVASGVPFAIQGGGHMTIEGAANINSSGILLSSAGLSKLALSSDGSTLSMGSGSRWANVYEYLEPHDKSVVGGRSGIVGVAGFLLGGGNSYFSNEYGLAASNVVRIECVLSDGTVVNATADNAHADLFWALHGGGNSLCIVTAFEIKTLDCLAVTVGMVEFTPGPEDTPDTMSEKWLDSVYAFAVNGSNDPKAHLEPLVTWTSYSGFSWSGFIFYNGNDTNPAALVNVTGHGDPADSPAVHASSFSYRSMANWAAETDAYFVQGEGNLGRAYVVPIVADREAMGLVYDAAIPLAQQRLADVAGGGITLAMQPVPRSVIVNGRGLDPAGDPMGIDAGRAPYVWIAITFIFTDVADTAVVEAFESELAAAVDEALDGLARDVRSQYLYLNNAEEWQPVFEGYRNLKRLKTIREKYDEAGVYTHQMPGGWKVATAKDG